MAVEYAFYTLADAPRTWCESNMTGAWKVSYQTKESDKDNSGQELKTMSGKELDAMVSGKDNTDIRFTGIIRLDGKQLRFEKYAERWVELECENERDAVLFKLHWF